MFVTVEGLLYPIELTYSREYLDIGDEMAQKSLCTLVNAGGFMAMMITKEHIEAAVKSTTSPLWNKSIRELRPGPCIAVLGDIYDLLTLDEQRAILYHEEAHLVHHDAEHAANDPAVITELVGDSEFIVNTAFELKADAYAAERVSKSAMLSGLMKAIRFQAGVIAKETGVSFLDLVTSALACSHISARINALQPTP